MFPALATQWAESLCWYSHVIDEEEKKIIVSLSVANFQKC